MRSLVETIPIDPQLFMMKRFNREKGARCGVRRHIGRVVSFKAVCERCHVPAWRCLLFLVLTHGAGRGGRINVPEARGKISMKFGLVDQYLSR